MAMPLIVAKLGLPVLLGGCFIGTGFMVLNNDEFKNSWYDNILVIGQTTDSSLVSDLASDVYLSSQVTESSTANATAQKSRNYKCEVEITDAKSNKTKKEFDCKLNKIKTDDAKKWMYVKEIKTSEPKKLKTKYENGKLIATQETEDKEIKAEDLKAKNNYYSIQMAYGSFEKYLSNNKSTTVIIKSFDSESKVFGSLTTLFSIYNKQNYGDTKHLLVKVKTINTDAGPSDLNNIDVSSSSKCSLLMMPNPQEKTCKIFDFGSSAGSILDNYNHTTTQTTKITKDHVYLIALEDSIPLNNNADIEVKISTTDSTAVATQSTAIFSPAIPASGAIKTDDGFLFVMRQFGPQATT